ncbi:MAG: response regulator [Alphaproteobacteria bacterium]|nr:response regulator [Alphaproteobacteria bacterium]
MTAASANEPVPSALSYADLRRRVLTVAVLFGALVLVVSLVGFAGLHQNAIEAARHRAQSYSTILSAHLDRTMGAMDARLAQIEVQSERLGGPNGPRGQWAAVLEAAKAGATTIGSLSVIDTNGLTRHSTLGELVGQPRRDGAIFNSLSDADAPEIISEPPFVSADGQLLMPLGRRLIDHGRVSGAVIATFSPDSLRNFYGSIDAEGGVVRVLHRNGTVLLEEPRLAAQSYVDPQVLSGAGIIRGPITQGGAPMITAYASSGESDLVVAVSLSEAQALAAWRQEAIVGGLIIAGMLIALSLAVALILRQLEARAVAETALLAQQHRFAEAQRLESLGQLTGGVAHDFNNLLTVIISAADSLLTRVSDDVRPRVDAILYAADNATNLIKQLLAFSRRQALQLSAVDVNSTVTAMEDMLRRSLGARVETQFVLAANLWRAHADRAQVESALLNLAINARDAMPEGGKLTVETHNAHLDEHYASQNLDVAPGDYIALAVTDTGVGMSPDVRERALEPFFTTKDVGKGSGLGLSMIYGFARQSKGHVKIYSEVGHGTTVRLYLPRDTSSVEDVPAAQVGASDAGTESILVVEDDAQVRLLAAASLKERGYAVTEATNGAEAITQLDTSVHFDLVLTDMVMPGTLTGKDVAEHALKARPGVKVLFTSGYADASVMRNGLVQAGARFLAKPYRGGQLAATVRSLLDA